MKCWLWNVDSKGKDMTSQRTQIISDDDLVAIDEAIASIDAQAPNIAAAKQAEIDVGDIEQRAAEIKRRLIGIKRAFRPESVQ